MKTLLEKIREKTNARIKKGTFSKVLIAIGVVLIVFSSYRLISFYSEDSAARNEYIQLREIFSAVIIPPTQTILPDTDSPRPPESYVPERPNFASLQGAEVMTDPMEKLIEINPDFVGWIRIDSVIDYPIVRGDDNKRYLNTTFQGKRNSSGAIFLDYRNSASFDDEVSIIYGHNMRGGSMFRPLHQLQNPEFLAEHQYIAIVTSDWRILIYRIFAVRVIDSWESENNPEQLTVASIHEAPENAEQILILSTCTTGANAAERLRVYAAKIDYVPAQMMQ